MRKNTSDVKRPEGEKCELAPAILNAREVLSAPNPTAGRRKKKSENDYYKVICPFFFDLSGHSIRCEGIIKDTKVSTSFGNVRAMKKHRRKFCNTFDYEKCELCKVLQSKYD